MVCLGFKNCYEKVKKTLKKVLSETKKVCMFAPAYRKDKSS